MPLLNFKRDPFCMKGNNNSRADILAIFPVISHHIVMYKDCHVLSGGAIVSKQKIGIPHLSFLSDKRSETKAGF